MMWRDWSAVIHTFYSDKYFRSFNCRREFYKAVALDKPIIIAYEGDDTVVDEMKEKCAKYCSEKYRNEGIDINHVLENILAKGRPNLYFKRWIVFCRNFKNWCI